MEVYTARSGFPRAGEAMIRTVALVLMLGLLMLGVAACTASKPVGEHQPGTAADNQTTIVHMSDFAFDPSHLVLKVGAPVRLQLVNDSDGGHDFSAPALFASSGFPIGSSMPPGGAIDVASHQSSELNFVPNAPGKYPVECTHFLHSLFGMEGVVEVIR